MRWDEIAVKHGDACDMRVFSEFLALFNSFVVFRVHSKFSYINGSI